MEYQPYQRVFTVFAIRDRVAELRAWSQDLNHHCEFIEEVRGEEVLYKIAVGDVHVPLEFKTLNAVVLAQEFGTAIEQIVPGE